MGAFRRMQVVVSRCKIIIRQDHEFRQILVVVVGKGWHVRSSKNWVQARLIGRRGDGFLSPIVKVTLG